MLPLPAALPTADCVVTSYSQIIRLLWTCFCVCGLLALPCRANEPESKSTSESIDFSRDIRPILSDNCFLCHGPAEEMREADLRLDQRGSAIGIGAIDPDNLPQSELIARIRSADPDVRMPPPNSGKALQAEEQDRLERWILQGAKYSEHWAFVPPQRPDVPDAGELLDGTGSSWVVNPIDAFVLARMSAHGLAPSPPAARETLLRRLYLDLTGLPPSPAELNEALAGNDNLESLVQQLMTSPHFGEKWALWWLDAARYADSDGYEKDKPRSVWFYRDWVIHAMQTDMPYNQFVVQQIAGDLLPGAGQNERVATGFLRNSMVNEEGGADPEQFRVEAIFDRVDAIGKSILGITTQCAQCHTHKYDPLSNREYYQMFAALNDFHEATISVFTPEQDRLRERIEGEVAAIEAELRAATPDWQQRLETWETTARGGLVQWQSLVPTERPWDGQKFRPLPDGSIISESYAPTRTTDSFGLDVQPQTITAFRIDVLTHPQLPRSGPGRSIYGTGALSEFEVEITSQDDPQSKRKVKFVRAISDVNAPRSLLPAIYRDREPDKDDRVTGPIAYAIDGDQKTAWTTDSGPADRNQDRYAVFFPERPIEIKSPSKLVISLRQMHGGWNSDDNQNYLLGRYLFSASNQPQDVERAPIPVAVQRIIHTPAEQRSERDRAALFSHWRTTVEEFADANARIASLWKSFPETDSQLVVQQTDQPRESFVMQRGDFLNPGEPVSPAAPEFLNAFPDTSEPDRLRFARWLVADDAPTTARVIVNRIWQAYFGRALVETPEDFGFQSAPPSHPDLLDWLAVELMENGWSLKHIHRLIVNSATYRQSSRTNGWLASQDPANRWLARGPRFRVNAEIVRDIALSASGLLDDAVGGPSVYPPAPQFLFQPPASYGPKQWPESQGSDAYRRSLYVHHYRSVAYPPLQVFDAPKGDAACVRRTRSNTPLQALVMLNEPQFVQCARAMAARVLREAKPDDVARLQYAHRLCVAREADDQELAVLQELLQQQRERVASGQVRVDSLVGTSEATFRQLTGQSPGDFAPWIVVCRALLNLDETITKE